MSSSYATKGALTVRQREVLRLKARGLTNAEAGAELLIAAATVKSELEGIYVRLGVRNVTAAVWKARSVL